MEILSQEDLNQYIRKLPPREACRFMIDRPVSLCCIELVCPYKGKESYTFRGEQKRECRREKILRYKKLLGDRT